jgi:hypothetical protein
VRLDEPASLLEAGGMRAEHDQAGVEASGAAAGGTRRAGCPRCGYDLGGEVARWVEQCPLRGRCTECGLEVEWGPVLTGGYSGWSFEGDVPVMVRRLLGTVLRSVWPDALWRRRGGVTMETAISGVRLLVLTGVFGLLGAVGWGVAAYGVKVRYYVEFGRLMGSSVLGDGLEPWLLDIEVGLLTYMGGCGLAMPAAALLFAGTLRRAKVLNRHLWRCTVYSLAPLMLSLTVPLLILKSGAVDSHWWEGREVASWFVLTPVVMALWWGRTITRYMRVAHGMWTGVLMAAVAHLAGMLVFVLGWGWEGMLYLV